MVHQRRGSALVGVGAAARLTSLVVAGLLLVAAGCTDSASPAGREGGTTPGPGPEISIDGSGDPVAGADTLGDPYVGSFGNAGYDVSRYELALDWFPDSGLLEGRTTIEAISTTTLASFHLDLIALDVEAVTVDGAAVDFEHNGSELLITPTEPLSAGAGFVTEVTYSGVPVDDRDPGSSVPSGWHTRDDYAFVAGEPVSAATFHPANDHPSDKAAFRYVVSAPEDLTVVANGRLESSDTADGRTTWTYDAPDQQATYLTTLLIGDFEVLDGGTSASGVEIRNVVQSNLLDVGEEAFVDQPRMIDAFEELFGPYPFDVYGAALVEDENFGGALETQTLSIFGGDVAGSEAVVAHELAHQWFGDDVSLERWEDLWLNEGFATYAEALWLEASEPAFSMQEWIEDIGSSGRLDEAIHPAPRELFSDGVYLRGALTLHALRTEVGDDIFFDILWAWTERHGGANATTADFESLAAEQSGQDLDALFGLWLRQPELPDRLDGVELGRDRDDG